MPQSLAKVLIHLTYSTDGRARWLKSEDRPALFAYMAGILKQWDSPALIIGGVEDHVHILFSLSRNHSLAKIVEEVKKGSSKWLKGRGESYADFAWQNGYGAFSVSVSNVEQVKTYVENQDEHHRTRTYKEELLGLFQRHGMEFDERYLWE